MTQAVHDRTMHSVNPADPSEQVHAFVPASVQDVVQALERADSAASAWAARPASDRSSVLARAAEILQERAAETGRLITREEGKALAAATGEVRKAAEQLRFAAQLAYQVEGTTYPEEVPGTFAYTLRYPLGVVVAITPWNFPVSLGARKIAPALAAGNAVLLKPSPVTPGAGEALARACWDAGVPQDVLHVVHGDDPDAMAALVGSPQVDAVSFTGSDQVGERLRRTVNPRARLQFELGGHNAAVVCADADLDRAVAAVASGAFELTGQACTATDRVLVQRPVYEAFIVRLAAKVEQLRVGPGDADGTTVGPVATAAQHTRLSALLESGCRDGRVVAQAHPVDGVDPRGYWVPPTVFADLPAAHPLNTGEIFGPFLSVLPVDTVDEAIALVNASRHGLVTAIHTRDVTSAHRFARRVTCGVVKVNERTTGNGVAPPFGGWKASSSGAFPEGGRQALDFVTDTKTVYFNYEEA